MAEPQSSSPSDMDPREAGRATRRERLVRRYGWVGPGIGGFILILLGIVFLAQNFGYPVPEKWWTIFLLIPAAGALYAAWRAYQHDGFSGEVIAPAIGGAALVLLSVALIFDFAWGTLWPVLLIAVGVGVLLRTYWH